jgi:ABC-type Fe3+/spermidine/putrescine transport system ATPase subunit
MSHNISISPRFLGPTSRWGSFRPVVRPQPNFAVRFILPGSTGCSCWRGTVQKALEKELKDLHKETGKTFIYITHSLEEAMVMSDRIGIMRAGRLVQIGTPEEIYNRPVDRFVSEFVGEVNVLEVRRVNGTWRGVDVPGSFKVTPPAGAPDAETACVVVRPEFLRFIGKGRQRREPAGGHRL